MSKKDKKIRSLSVLLLSSLEELKRLRIVNERLRADNALLVMERSSRLNKSQGPSR